MGVLNSCDRLLREERLRAVLLDREEVLRAVPVIGLRLLLLIQRAENWVQVGCALSVCKRLSTLVATRSDECAKLWRELRCLCHLETSRVEDTALPVRELGLLEGLSWGLELQPVGGLAELLLIEDAELAALRVLGMGCLGALCQTLLSLIVLGD